MGIDLTISTGSDLRLGGALSNAGLALQRAYGSPLPNAADKVLNALLLKLAVVPFADL